MLNSFVIVGFIKESPVFFNENGEQKCILKVETDRPYRSACGTIETDLFNVKVWKGIADEIASVCVPGTMVAIKGRLFSDHEQCGIIAEHISFPGRSRSQGISFSG